MRSADLSVSPFVPSTAQCKVEITLTHFQSPHCDSHCYVIETGAMGCVASKLDINDVHPNMFAVVNVNDVSLKCDVFI